ncbi:uncharacterized protein LOC123541552 [Mercenaria mercenaria]|uniref:uncharacterized protein LOC123541552 n=1 Tax=Mercenaria mercenaria TaxID=6596 RepID=UPI00234F312D|nr:uncharacterized protein LOC123541552 [Mercenaria mercenaria]
METKERMMGIFCFIFILLQGSISASISLNKPCWSSDSFLRTRLLEGCTGTQVAFHAYLSSTKCYRNHKTFIFDRVQVNRNGGNGGWYNENTGIFVVPKTGLYAMTWTVAADHGTWFSAQLMVNGEVKGVVMTDADVSGSGIGVHPATGFVLTRLSHDSHVNIRFVSGHGCEVKSDGLIRNTFSGWLMNAAA